LKTKWKNTKFGAKVKASIQKAELKKTGGGPPPKPLDETTEQILSIFGSDGELTSNFDSESVAEQGAKMSTQSTTQPTPLLATHLATQPTSLQSTLPTPLPSTSRGTKPPIQNYRLDDEGNVIINGRYVKFKQL
jgi:hypothetical protein